MKQQLATHTIAVLVQDQPGVLQRVSGLFGRRGFNINSITVGSSEEPGLSRMIITTSGDDAMIEQIQKQLYKLIDVIQVRVISASPMVARELALINVSALPAQRPEIMGVVDTFRASVIDIGPSSIIIQAVGDSDKVEAMIELLKPYGIREVSRTGTTAMLREGQQLRMEERQRQPRAQEQLPRTREQSPQQTSQMQPNAQAPQTTSAERSLA
ncbi:acetolactate synthase, small subunit [Paenibacillus curdlanolyticus YK9]|uniref:acetolactate synthase n=1 Tax=Paenibacillus curdlanolyticus YK9 TaxID=717606 RepID=E0IG18_9BACL|nr:acetolactate synthase, small subunit [Paenibacillus curdlanolyticus YK9]